MKKRTQYNNTHDSLMYAHRHTHARARARHTKSSYVIRVCVLIGFIINYYTLVHRCPSNLFKE